MEHNRFSLLYIANFHYHAYIWFKADPAHTALDLLWLDRPWMWCQARNGSAPWRQTTPGPTYISIWFKQICQRYKYYMYYIRVEAVDFSVRNHPPLPPAMNTMNFRLSHATYEKAPTSQWVHLCSISISKQSRLWPGSYYKSCRVLVSSVYKAAKSYEGLRMLGNFACTFSTFLFNNVFKIRMSKKLVPNQTWC